MLSEGIKIFLIACIIAGIGCVVAEESLPKTGVANEEKVLEMVNVTPASHTTAGYLYQWARCLAVQIGITNIDQIVKKPDNMNDTRALYNLSDLPFVFLGATIDVEDGTETVPFPVPSFLRGSPFYLRMEGRLRPSEAYVFLPDNRTVQVDPKTGRYIQEINLTSCPLA